MTLSARTDAALRSFGTAAERDVVQPDASVPADRCTSALVLVGVDRSPLSKAIDKLTGGRGFSHVYVDPCRVVDGERRVVDYSVRHGVTWASPDVYRSRRRVRVELSPAASAMLWPCIRARMGRPLRILPLALAGDANATCIGLVLTCMPAEFRAMLEELREGPCVSPNTLARWAGVA